MGNTFIAVEGPHDVELVSALLESMDFWKETKIERLQALFCERLIDTKFPYRGDLHRRVPNPMFLTDGTNWTAVQACGGDTEIASTVRQALRQLQVEPDVLSSLGIVRDADDKTPQEQVERLLTHLAGVCEIPHFAITFPAAPSEVTEGRPRFGIYILPDQTSTGTIEDILLECGQWAYPRLLTGASHYVEHVDLTGLSTKDLELFNKPSGRNKAKVACVANILKPGMSLAVSIDQNRWLEEGARNLPRVQALNTFLKSLCGIP